jgi:hypothetical protein
MTHFAPRREVRQTTDPRLSARGGTGLRVTTQQGSERRRA